jgi:hypothetical protein
MPPVTEAAKQRKREYNAAWKKSPSGRLSSLAQRLKWNYGMTLEQWAAALKTQRGLCDGCHKKRTLLVDHDHSTGLFRAGLCRPCNIILGHAHDDPRVFRRLATYLEAFGPSGSNYERQEGKRRQLPEIKKVYR